MALIRRHTLCIYASSDLWMHIPVTAAIIIMHLMSITISTQQHIKISKMVQHILLIPKIQETSIKISVLRRIIQMCFLSLSCCSQLLRLILPIYKCTKPTVIKAFSISLSNCTFQANMYISPFCQSTMILSSQVRPQFNFNCWSFFQSWLPATVLQVYKRGCTLQSTWSQDHVLNSTNGAQLFGNQASNGYPRSQGTDWQVLTFENVMSTDQLSVIKSMKIAEQQTIN